ncbi:MAG: sulfatase-like hydrolase/transferase [Sandaracinaceae bacterium]
MSDSQPDEPSNDGVDAEDRTLADETPRFPERDAARDAARDAQTSHAEAVDADDRTLEDAPSPDAKAPTPVWKKALGVALKIAVSAAGLYLVYGAAMGRDGMSELRERIGNLSWGWFVAAMAMQTTAIGFAIVRWRFLLGGQGIKAGYSFLAPSFMIGRFWGAFTPGGLGLDGWRLFDVATRTKKNARAVTVTVVEKILGQLAFGLVVMGGSVWGLSLMGVSGVLLVNGFFVVLVAVGLTFLARPKLFLPLFRVFPKQIRPRMRTLMEAVTAYHGRMRLLAIAVLCGVAVHAFNNLIYVCAAQAMHLEVSPFVMFFASSIVIMSTIVPLSLNGVGLREATAAGVLGAFGVAAPVAAATYTLGWIAEMCVSACGIPFLLARKAGSDARLTVEDADREDAIYAELEAVPSERWPKIGRAVGLGAGAGLLGGMIVGVGEGVAIVVDGGGRAGFGVLAYGAVAYGLLAAIGGAWTFFVSALIGRGMRREAVPEPQAFARMVGLTVAAFAFALGAFRIRRDVFHEELVWKSGQGLMVLGGCALGALVLYAVLSFTFRTLTRLRLGRWLLEPWGSPVMVGALSVGLAVFGAAYQPSVEAQTARAAAPENAPNVLVIVVDTLRADHLPAYGYADGHTPSLDRFAEDAVRYDQAFSNASWTRPSFASILTGRYPSSHGVMGKPDALPDELTTLAEALSAGGYRTSGIVTNFNVGPYFNFQQGFDDYRFLEPEFVLGADDNAAKLLLMQALRQGIERYRAARGQVEPGTAYQDAETVNRHLLAEIDAQPSDGAPWFRFVGYMDPHDPYFPHPYDGSGYSRAAHQSPDVAEADRLRGMYDGEITYWDAHFGRLMDALRERGLYDDTLIIVTADHGEEFAEHGGFWHGTTLYDEQVHVPLFVKLPENARAGTHVSHWVESIDLMPSILRIAGVAVPDGVQGGSLDEGTTRVYAEESHEGNVLESVRERRDFEEYKLILANANNPRGLAPVELYRVADDPSERVNAALTDRESVQSLMPAMEEARTRASQGAVEGNEMEMDDATREQLCRLGYIDASICCRDGFLSGEQCRGT